MPTASRRVSYVERPAEGNGSSHSAEVGDLMRDVMFRLADVDNVDIEEMGPGKVVIRYRAPHIRGGECVYTYTGFNIKPLLLMVGLFAKVHPQRCSEEVLAVAPTTNEEFERFMSGR